MPSEETRLLISPRHPNTALNCCGTCRGTATPEHPPLRSLCLAFFLCWEPRSECAGATWYRTPSLTDELSSNFDNSHECGARVRRYQMACKGVVATCIRPRRQASAYAPNQPYRHHRRRQRHEHLETRNPAPGMAIRDPCRPTSRSPPFASPPFLFAKFHLVRFGQHRPLHPDL
ncbi:hypothetical protein BCR34DRAFT_243978 [Clohesyomyces aquaticus]|uniref:Uncharacterized protein n=1 Tax=Clohesyomyces aquaticus TaxID=1231657 RepID=A0A1Y1ZUT4_9PLEO|nr:hypothetical protein BCR34DRAFT_243978 [Clohesyomyces aquaticus]